MAMKSWSVVSWHHQTPERRQLKRARLGPPDVYPQDVKQEEDYLGADRLKKGYQVAVTSYEHESTVWNAKVARLDRLEETMVRGAQVVMQVLHKKLELNANLDKERKRGTKDGVFQNFSHTVRQADKSKERKEWFTDLARGKSLASLARRPPFFRKKEDALEYLCDFKVPVARALWFLKLVAVGQGITSNVNKQKKSTNDQLASEHASLFTKYIKMMLSQMSDSAKLDTNIVYTERWPHFVCICKHAYEDGMIERQEFLMDMCDIFADRFVQRSDRPHFLTLLRLFLMLFSQFTDQITQNLLLSRRCAFLVARRLAMNKREMEEIMGRSVSVSEMLDDMTQCQNQRAIILILCGMLYAILIDCPGALIWNNFQVAEGRPPPLLHHLCGSPLDVLPCGVDELPMPPGHGSDKLHELVQLRVAEVKRRSRAVDHRWSLNQTHKAGFAQTVHACLEILGALDAARMDQPRCIERIYNLIFNGSTKERFEHEHAIRIKVLLHWAVTVEREGSHRALVVSSVLALRVNHRKGFKFGDRHLQEILVEYLDTEGPQVSEPHFLEEFANLMHTFMELQRAGVFSHDSYVRELITTGEMSEQLPIMALVKNRQHHHIKNFQHHDHNMHNGERAPSQNDFRSDEFKDERMTGQLAWMPPDKVPEHPLMGHEISPHERFLIHLPVPQTNEYRSDCNQRALLLYGIGDQRDTVKNELKKSAREITKIWSKRIVIEFSFSKPSEIRFKKRANREQINEALQKFKSQTYYDQVVLCGWCCDNLVSMITDFVDGHGAVLPAAEGFDVLLSMMEHCKNLADLMELAEELLPLLASVERVLAERRVDCVPSLVSTHLGYVLVSYIAHNYYYFLHFENATNIVNGLYRLIENQLKSPEACLTGWGRTIGIFVLNASNQLIEAELTYKRMAVNRDLLKRLLPPWKFSTAVNTANYNPPLFKELFEAPKRIFSFNEYRRLNSLIKDEDCRYSLVVSALTAARQCGHDYDKLVELANMCAHLSAQASISAEWCGALQALCCSSVAGNHGFTDLFLVINVEDSKCHYSIATFYMLLAARNCFSMNALFHQLLHSALASLLKSDAAKTDVDAEAGVCLALLVLANMVCQSDEPIMLSPLYTGGRDARKSVSGNADKFVLSAGHLHDIGEAIFELLFAISLIADFTKGKLRDRPEDKNEHSFRREYISQISKAVLMAMCEQDWVTQRVYRVCEQTNMDVFNSHKLRKNCLGQQLLRMALRRRCERRIVHELTVCNGNSKKSLIDKLLSVLNIWNIRATYFDLKLMIKEISPEGSSNKHAQQLAIAADALIGEIGKCCRDLFTASHKSEKKLPDAAIGKMFRLKHITNYWLISPLVRLCPKPGNLPASFPAVTVQAKFLREAASMLDTANDSSKERIQQSAWLLSQEPFLNLVLTCLKGEEQQRDGLVGSLLKQLQDLATKTKDKPTLPYLRKLSLEREGLLLRLSLVGGMFDSVCHPSSCDAWALLFFQLMLYGVVSRERDRFLFESCFDMLSTLLVWSITDPMNAVPVNSQDPDTKYRFASYSVIVKKLRKELNERALIPELRCLMQFLPIPKPAFELITCEPYGTVPMSPQKLSKGQMGASPPKPFKQGLQFGEKVKISAYDMVQNFNSESSMKRTWTWAMFQAVRLDRSPVPIQKHIQRLIQHAHYNEFVRPTICGMDRPPTLDIYLSPPTMDVSETPVSVHHVAASTTATTTTSTTTPTPVTVSGPMAVSQASTGEPMMFPSQVTSMQQLPDMTRPQTTASPRGARGGRRKNAAGPSSRSQGSTRKKQQRQAAVAAEQLSAAVPSSGGGAAMAAAAQAGMPGPGNAPTPGYGWAPQQPGGPQPQQMQQFAGSQQSGAMNQPEDSKMKIHSMILQKRQAQAASCTTSQNFQTMSSAPGTQYGQVMMKMEPGTMQMDTQQSYPAGAPQMSISQEQGPQYAAQQRNYNAQQAQNNTGNVFDTRMMSHQQQQAMQFNQQQYPQQY